MELRGQDKEIGMPNSLGFHPANRDSSSKVPSAPIISAFGERRRDHHTGTPQTLEQVPLYHHQQLNLQHQTLKPTKDPDLIPDPAPAAATSTATNSAPTPSRSISRSPPATSTAIITTPTSISSVRYRECLKNHAASMGGHVVDGCGEFMPSGEEGSIEALKCAACKCHRNFHKREIDGEPQYLVNSHYKNNGQRNTLPTPQQHVTSLPPPQPSLHQHHIYPHGSLTAYSAPIAPMMMAFGGGGGGSGAAAESSSEDLNMFQSTLQGQASVQQPSLKKRFRTKFSQEQKEKMMEFAEKLGWKIQKQDEQEVQQFCSEVGVKRKVFKVWMHNNKQVMKKKQM